jgi:F-type H+-transporting ATPase subunit delta
MKVTPRQFAQILHEILEVTAPADTDKILDNFVEVLKEHNALSMFDAINEEFEKLDLEKKGIKQAEVTTALPLSHENEREIVERLNKIVKGDVQLKKKLDENLIGGAIMQVEDKVIDTSVKNSLDKLKQELSK